MEEFKLFDNDPSLGEVKLDDLQIDVDTDIPTFEDNEFEYIKKDNKEELKRQIKNLAPEVKAAEVFKLYNSNNRSYPIIGHEKRVLMRKLIRDAKNGKLDKYFITE